MEVLANSTALKVSISAILD